MKGLLHIRSLSQAPVWFYRELESTMQTAAAALSSRTWQHGEAWLAGYQRQGQGRQGRYWYNQHGALLQCSLALDRDRMRHDPQALGIISAWAVLRMLTKLGVANGAIKWPNDVLVGGRKIAGILLHERYRRGKKTGNGIILGIGFNIRTHPKLAEVGGIALTQLRPPPLPRIKTIFLLLIHELEAALASPDWQKGCEQCLYLQGQRVTYRLPHSEQAVQGRILGIRPNGALRLLVGHDERDILSGSLITDFPSSE